jgi:hypothetical protein
MGAVLTLLKGKEPIDVYIDFESKALLLAAWLTPI